MERRNTDLPSFEELKSDVKEVVEPVARETKNKVKKFLEKRKKVRFEDEGDPPAAAPTPIPANARAQSKKVNPRVKFQQYKLCFPEETKTFKALGKDATDRDWTELFEEMDTVISCKGLQAYLENLVLAGVQGLESWFDQDGNFDMRGASTILKNNPEFQTVCKRLYLKYNLFKAAPPELQLLIIVASACMTAMKKNQARRHLGEVLSKEN